jgi:hypothetical protein
MGYPPRRVGPPPDSRLVVRVRPRRSYPGTAYRAIHPSTPATRATQEARRADSYPLPDGRLATLQSSIRRRIRPIARIPREAFDALVLDMARVALRWSRDEVEAREYPTRPTAF